MAKPLFNKSISPSCAHCMHGRTSEYTDEIFCIKRGITNKNESCRHYKYDVLKRIPTRIKPAADYTPEDFKL